MSMPPSPRHWSGDRISVTADGDRLQGYHRLEIEADTEYDIELWKDGALPCGPSGYRLRENPDPGVELAITADDHPDERYRISPGRSSDTSHYADLKGFDDDTLAAAADAVQEYMEDVGDTGADEIEEFFDAVRDGLL